MIIPDQKWGIKICPKKKALFKDTITFTLRIANSSQLKEGELFITSKKIRAIISEINPNARGRIKIGSVTVEMNRDAKLFVTARYYPTEMDLFRHIGVATLAEHEMEKYLEQEYPGWKIRSTTTPLKERRDQLIARGRIPGQVIPIAAAKSLTAKQIIAQKSKAVTARTLYTKPKVHTVKGPIVTRVRARK